MIAGSATQWSDQINTPNDPVAALRSRLSCLACYLPACAGMTKIGTIFSGESPTVRAIG